MHEVKELMAKDAQVIDVRDPLPLQAAIYQKQLIFGKSPAYAGWFLNYEEPIIIIDDNNNNIDELRRHMVRLGYDNVYGYLSGGFSVWFKCSGDFETVKTWSA